MSSDKSEARDSKEKRRSRKATRTDVKTDVSDIPDAKKSKRSAVEEKMVIKSMIIKPFAYYALCY